LIDIQKLHNKVSKTGFVLNDDAEYKLRKLIFKLAGISDKKQQEHHQIRAAQKY